MTRETLRGLRGVVCLLSGLTVAQTSLAASAPSVAEALRLKPVHQADVDYDLPSPAEVEKCEIAPIKDKAKSGWIIRGPSGRILRSFVDSNNDKYVDRWSYYRDGIEVYRDVDTDFNGKVDENRWLNTLGSRWALDKNEDGEIDQWRRISAEEVSAEVVAALKNADAKRFSRLLLTQKDIKQLSLSSDQGKELQKKLGTAVSQFEKMAKKQTIVKTNTQWMQFGGSRPGAVISNNGGADLLVYENVVAMVETDNEQGYLQVGTLIKVGESWKLIAAPQDSEEEVADLSSPGFFYTASFANRPALPADGTFTGPNEAVQKLLTSLEQLEEASTKARTPLQMAQLNKRRADILMELIRQTRGEEEKRSWVRQFADVVSASVLSGEYPGGAERLVKLRDSLKDKELAAYVDYRRMMADYYTGINSPDADFAELQEQWLTNLNEFVKKYPHSSDTADAMLQLATTYEFSGEESKAALWYGKVVSQFPDSPMSGKAAGAKRRLESVGKPISLRGRSIDGKRTIDLSRYKGRITLIQYWTSESEVCKAELPQLKELLAKYARKNFNIIGVNLDSSKETLTRYLGKNRLPWPQIYESGSFDSRLANEMGILTLPTMILVDEKGNVYNRGIHVSELDATLGTMLK